jgi:predicted transcriptional regulator
MGCVNPDGSLTESARKMLKYLSEPHSPEDAAAALGQPLFKVRASLREMVESGLVFLTDDSYQSTGRGLEKIR